jgi:hypothetical protein
MPRPYCVGVTRRTAAYLRLFAAWTVFVWATFIRNISGDHTHSTGFKVVHITLAVVSLALATGAFVVVSRARRAQRGARHIDQMGGPPGMASSAVTSKP